MPLTDEQKQLVRDEEFFRAEIRRELAQAGGPPSFLTRLSAFFDTKAGFWLLTTALASLVAAGLTSLQRVMDREAIAARTKAERALRDTETLLKLAPMLTSEKLPEVKIAVVLLMGLASDGAVDERVSSQVSTLISDANQVKPDATPQEHARTDAITSYVDKARLDEIRRPGAEATAAAPSPVVAAAITLPVRVYIQIGQESDRAMAQAVREKLRGAGLAAPGIELVGAGRSPQQDSVRYCNDKVTEDALKRVKEALTTLGPAAPALTVLDSRFCGKVRPNHFELWFARRAE